MLLGMGGIEMVSQVTYFRNDLTGELFELPSQAIESEFRTAEKIAEPHWKCVLCNMVLHDKQLMKNRCPECGNEVVQMHPDSVATLYLAEQNVLHCAHDDTIPSSGEGLI